MIFAQSMLEFLLSFLRSVLFKGAILHTSYVFLEHYFSPPPNNFYSTVYQFFSIFLGIPFFTHGTVGAPLACPFDRLVFRVCDEKLQDPT